MQASCIAVCDDVEYEFGAVLTPRPLPFLTNRITFWMSYVISPTHFYILADDQLTMEIDALSARLNSIYPDSKRVSVSRPEIGSFWVVKESNDLNWWCRARVLKLNEDDQTVQVILVDFGKIETVEIAELRPLVKEVVDLPCLAIRCRLGGIYPPGRKVIMPWLKPCGILISTA